MALTRMQLAAVRERLAIVNAILGPLGATLEVFRNDRADPSQKAYARAVLTYCGQGILAVLADDVGAPLPAPYTAAQVDTIEAGLAQFKGAGDTLLNLLNIALQPAAIINEDGNVVSDFTAAQKTGFETEGKRLYGKMKTLLGALP